MKKIKLFALCLVSFALAFSSCNKDDDNNDNGDGGNVIGNVINVSVTDGVSYDIDSIYITGNYDVTEEIIIIARAAYNKGNFSITLPETLDAKFLERAGNFLFEGMTASDSLVLLSGAYTLKAYKDGNIVGSIHLMNTNPTEATEAAIFMYSDGVVQIGGEVVYDEEGDKEKEKFNMSFVKGWNVLRMKMYTEDGYDITEYTIGNTSGLNWYFIDDSYDFFAPRMKGSVMKK